MKNVKNTINEIEKKAFTDVIATEDAIKVEKQDAVRATLFFKILRGIFELTTVVVLTGISLMVSSAMVMGTFKFVTWLLFL